MMEMKLATQSQVRPLKVLGNVNSRLTIVPMIMKMIVQAPWSVMAFIMIEKVRMWEPIIKTMKSS